MNRHGRRKANSGSKDTIVANNREIFSTPNLGVKEIRLDVGPMRAWAEKHITPQKIRIDFEHVGRLIDKGTVTKDRVMGHTIYQMPKPILVCGHPDGIGDEIVDGNHTYVAEAKLWLERVKRGILSQSAIPFVVGYSFTVAQWRPFIISSS